MYICNTLQASQTVDFVTHHVLHPLIFIQVLVYFGILQLFPSLTMTSIETIFEEALHDCAGFLLDLISTVLMNCYFKTWNPPQNFIC